MTPRSVLAIALFVLPACGSRLSSAEEASYAYLGLDGALSRATMLGLRGFSEADSANIATQTAAGDVSGTMTVDGQADQGASANKGLRLDVALEDYADIEDLDDDEDDEVAITYHTDPEAPLPAFDLQLKDMPSGTLSGSIVGTFYLEGDLVDEVTLNLQIDGAIEADPDITDGVRRVVGGTTVTGTATTAGGGTFAVAVTI